MNMPEVTTSSGSVSIPGRREVLKSHLFILGLVGILALTLGLRFSGLRDMPDVPFAELVFWAVLILAMNLFPFTSGDLSFTLDTPLLLTIALLYPPEVACILAFVGSMDVREVQGRVGPMRALFNRTQIALSVLLAGLMFRSVTGGDLD
ncbi:MAG: hypothetical protein ACRDH9_02545, partial [Actinomycetota bacterium]